MGVDVVTINDSRRTSLTARTARDSNIKLGDVVNGARVFVGNIPRYTTQEEVTEVLSVFGPVVSFRLVVDSASGRHKGYGFCQFRDEETARSAQRNQQGLAVCKDQQLRVAPAFSSRTDERRGQQNLPDVQAPNKVNICSKEGNYEWGVANSSQQERELDVFQLRQAAKKLGLRNHPAISKKRTLVQGGEDNHEPSSKKFCTGRQDVGAPVMNILQAATSPADARHEGPLQAGQAALINNQQDQIIHEKAPELKSNIAAEETHDEPAAATETQLYCNNTDQHAGEAHDPTAFCFSQEMACQLQTLLRLFQAAAYSNSCTVQQQQYSTVRCTQQLIVQGPQQHPAALMQPQHLLHAAEQLTCT